MIIMHGLFDLKDGIEEEAFRQSFDLFSVHLKDNHLVVSWRFMRHQAHEGYNSSPPATRYYVSMEFTDMEHAERCWAVVEANDEPIRAIHSAVFSKIENYRFFLSSDV